MGKADLQIHSNAGDGLDSLEQILDHVETRTDLDVIALTDHDAVRPAMAMRELAARSGARVQVVIGIEVTTRSGHLLALFVDKDIPMLRPLRETVRLIHECGGLAVVPHPLSYLTFSIGERALRRLAADGERVDGVETMNPSIAGRVRAARAAILNRDTIRAAETGSSDAHRAVLVGTAWTEVPGHTAEDVRRAIIDRTTVANGKPWGVRDHLHRVAQQQWRSMVVAPVQKARGRRWQG